MEEAGDGVEDLAGAVLETMDRREVEVIAMRCVSARAPLVGPVVSAPMDQAEICWQTAHSPRDLDLTEGTIALVLR